LHTSQHTQEHKLFVSITVITIPRIAKVRVTGFSDGITSSGMSPILRFRPSGLLLTINSKSFLRVLVRAKITTGLSFLEKRSMTTNVKVGPSTISTSEGALTTNE